MKKMKKLVAVLLCITCGSLAMSGCGSNSSESADGRSVIRVGTMPYYLGLDFFSKCHFLIVNAVVNHPFC